MRAFVIAVAVLLAAAATGGLASAGVRHGGAGTAHTHQTSSDSLAAQQPSPESSTVTATHGQAVSAVAQDQSLVATKTLTNGKTVTNHGQAVALVARSGASDARSGAGSARAAAQGAPANRSSRPTQ